MSRELTVDYRTTDQDGRRVVIDASVNPELDIVIGIFDSDTEDYLVDTFIDLWS